MVVLDHNELQRISRGIEAIGVLNIDSKVIEELEDEARSGE
jgi:hypothetical protein